MLTEGSVEGTKCIKSHGFAYFGDRIIGIYKQLTRRGNSKGVYVVVKAYIQFIAHYMGYIVFIQMQVVGENVKGKGFIVILAAVVHNTAYYPIIS